MYVQTVGRSNQSAAVLLLRRPGSYVLTAYVNAVISRKAGKPTAAGLLLCFAWTRERTYLVRDEVVAVSSSASAHLIYVVLYTTGTDFTP